MMRQGVMISIRPEYIRRIRSGEKTVELRKTLPRFIQPYTIYFYCTKNGAEPSDDAGKVIGEARATLHMWAVEHPDRFAAHPLLYRKTLRSAAVTDEEAIAYANGHDVFGILFDSVRIYETPRELSEFGIRRPPQSWCYV